MYIYERNLNEITEITKIWGGQRSLSFAIKWNFQCPEWVTAKELQAIWAPQKPSNNKAIAKVIGCFLQIDSKVLFLDNAFIIHWTRGNQSGVYQKPSFLLTNVHGTKSYSECYQRKKVNINPATTPFWICNSDLSEKYMVHQWHRSCGSNQPLFGWI